ncbi:PLP-dependent aminotransferase family protein [Cetobacterium sp. SF1]|uniref:aminotransferase-like domain-containing protein n=1 Tax=Cetobacterium sp. SF1 TaxID=3417654 RepID=UPI003CF1F76D
MGIEYKKLYEIIKTEILSGKLKDGQKLPSIRKCVFKYKLSMATVFHSYELLEKNGYIEKVAGKGCFVKSKKDFSLEKRTIPMINAFKDGQVLEKNEINFSSGTLPSKYFPIRFYKKLSEKILNIYGASIFEYQQVQGVKSLRETLAESLEEDDIFVTENEILINSGTQQSLEIVLKLFSKNGKKNIIISEPTYPNAMNVFNDNCKINTVKLEKDGWNMEEFENILKSEKIDFIYEVFNFHNPTGVSWSKEKREKLLKLSKLYDFYIVEDDTFSDYFYTSSKPLPLKSMDKIDEERVIYIRTYSKTIMPGMGIALMVIPPILLEKGILTKYGIDTTTSGLNQRILEYYIKENYYKIHIKKVRRILKLKYLKGLSTLKECKNLKLLYIPEGGFFFWIEILKEIEVDDFQKRAIEKGISFLNGSMFFYNNQKTKYIRLSFTNGNLKEIEDGIKKIDLLLDEK